MQKSISFLYDHFLKTCMKNYILNFGHPVRGLIPTIRGSQRENICMPTLLWKNISSVSYLTRKCVCSLFFFPFLFQLAQGSFLLYIPCLLFLFGSLVICSTSVSDIGLVLSTHYCVSKILHHLFKKILASAI